MLCYEWTDTALDSNTAFSILACKCALVPPYGCSNVEPVAAVVSYYNTCTEDADLTWSELAAREVLAPLNMTHSFFGAVPDSLFPDISVPGGENWADLIVGAGYDPVAGMWVRI